MKRQLFRVSCKVALYTPDKSRVLVVEYKKGDYGLPGGHLELDENPEMAARRELREELGINFGGKLILKRSWIHPNGKVIIGYTGTLKADTVLTLDPKEVMSAKWATIKEVASAQVNTHTYRNFIIAGAR